jgi:hypothetical protein
LIMCFWYLMRPKRHWISC